MKKFVYKNKKTGKVVVTGEKLDKRQWTLIGERMNGQMNPKKINTK